jgi:hypothetical protein
MFRKSIESRILSFWRAKILFPRFDQPGDPAPAAKALYLPDFDQKARFLCEYLQGPGFGFCFVLSDFAEIARFKNVDFVVHAIKKRSFVFEIESTDVFH